MTVIPTENQREIVRIARDVLPAYARPDVRPMNRWVVLSLSERDVARFGPDDRERLAERLREKDYQVSVVGDDVKVTRGGLHWPDVE